MSYYKRHLFICTNTREDGVCCQQHDAREKRDAVKNPAGVQLINYGFSRVFINKLAVPLGFGAVAG